MKRFTFHALHKGRKVGITIPVDARSEKQAWGVFLKYIIASGVEKFAQLRLDTISA